MLTSDARKHRCPSEHRERGISLFHFPLSAFDCHFLYFDTLMNSFALDKTLTQMFSTSSTLFTQNTGCMGGGSGPLRPLLPLRPLPPTLPAPRCATSPAASSATPPVFPKPASCSTCTRAKCSPAARARCGSPRGPSLPPNFLPN